MAATDAVDDLHSTAGLEVELRSRGVDHGEHNVEERGAVLLAAHLPYPTVYLAEHLTFERVHLFEDRQASVEAGDDTLSPFFADPEAGAGRIDHTFGDNVDVDEAAFGKSGTIGSEEFTVALFREVDTVARMFQGEGEIES